MTGRPPMPRCPGITLVGGFGAMARGVVVLCCSVVVACGGGPASVEDPDGVGTRPAAGLSCAPETLRPGDTLTITMSLPHPPELAISGPDEAWYWLQSDDPDLPSLYPPGEFAQLRELRLDVDTAKGVVWIDTGPEKRRIFDTGGTYTIHLAENLETEPENTLYFEDTVAYVAAGPDGPEE